MLSSHCPCRNRSKANPASPKVQKPENLLTDEFISQDESFQKAIHDVAPQVIHEMVEQALSDLKTPYVDLVLLHSAGIGPLTFLPYLQKYVDQGKIRNLGVSNFNQQQLEKLYKNPEFQNSKIQIAESHQMSVSQVVLRWLVLELNDHEMTLIDSLGEDSRPRL